MALVGTSLGPLRVQVGARFQQKEPKQPPTGAPSETKWRMVGHYDVSARVVVHPTVQLGHLGREVCAVGACEQGCPGFTGNLEI